MAGTNASTSLGGIVAVVGREQPYDLEPQANVARPATVDVIIVLGVLGAGGSKDGGGAAPLPLALERVLPLRIYFY